MRGGRFELPLRIVIDDLLPGLAVALQRGAAGKAELVSSGTGGFDLEIIVDGALRDGRPRLLGPCVQGPPDGRFVYLCVGQMAGDTASPWSGRLKVPLGDLTWELIEAAGPGATLEGHVPGRGRNGGPALASVPILPPGWRVAG